MRISDWSSDVCSSDLLSVPAATVLAGTADRRPPVEPQLAVRDRLDAAAAAAAGPGRTGDRKSVVWGTSVSVRVDLGGRLVVKEKNEYRYRTVFTLSQ